MTERVTTLPNGVRVVSINMPHIETVSVGVFVRTGARNESPKLEGISHFLEHMAFKGTKNRDVKTISLSIERLGAYMNAYTAKDMTVYYMDGLAKHAGVFADILGDMMQNNIFPQDELDREREVIIQEYNRSQDSPSRVAYDLLHEAAYTTKQSMGRTTLGPKKNIKAFTREDFIDYVNTHYTGPNMVVGVAGNVTHEEALRMAEQHFAGVPNGTRSTVEAPVYHGGTQVKRKSAFTQSNVELAFPISTLAEDYFPDLLADSVLGGGMSSPLFQEIREKRGLVYSVYSYADLMDNAGLLRIGAGTTPEHLDEFFNVTCDVLKQLAHKVDPIDMERARNQLEVSAMQRIEKPFSRLEAAVEDLFEFDRIVPVREFSDRLASVTTEQVQQRFERLLTLTPSIALAGKGADERFFDQVVQRLKS